MPNHIKNRITMSGEQSQIEKLVEKYSSHYERKERLAFDGSEIFIHTETEEPGWLNKETKVFSRREKEDVMEIPEGFEKDFTDAWTRFPDFNKIIEMPESLNIESDSWVSPLEGRFGSNTTLASHLNSLRAYCAENPNSKDGTVENFIKGVRNYLDHGHATWYSWALEKWGTKWNCYDCQKLSSNIFEFDTAWSSIPELIEAISLEFPEVEILYEYSDEDTGSNCGIIKFKNGELSATIFPNSSKEAYEHAFKLRPDIKKHYQLIGDNYEYKDE